MDPLIALLIVGAALVLILLLKPAEKKSTNFTEAAIKLGAMFAV